MKKTETIKQIRGKNITDLTKDLDKEYVKLRDLKFSRSFRKLKDTRSIGKTKKNIARIWTIIGQKAASDQKSDKTISKD